jgi:hypothetical protein
VTLEFRRRLYDTRLIHPHARTRLNARQRIRIDTGRHTFYVDSDQWRHLCADIANCDHPALRQRALEAAGDARHRNETRTERTEVSLLLTAVEMSVSSLNSFVWCRFVTLN